MFGGLIQGQIYNPDNQLPLMWLKTYPEQIETSFCVFIMILLSREMGFSIAFSDRNNQCQWFLWFYGESLAGDEMVSGCLGNQQKKQQAMFDFDLSHWNSLVYVFLCSGHVLASNVYTPGI